MNKTHSYRICTWYVWKKKKKKCCWYKSVWEKVKSFLPLPLITERKKKKSLRKRKKKSSDLLSQGSQPAAQTEASWEFTVFTIVSSNKDNDIKEVQVPSSLDSNFSSTSNFRICNPDSRFGRSLCLNTDGCWGKVMLLIYNIWMNSSRLEGIKGRNTWKLLYFLSYRQRVFMLLFALESLPQRICIYTCLYQQFFKGKKKSKLRYSWRSSWHFVGMGSSHFWFHSKQTQEKWDFKAWGASGPAWGLAVGSPPEHRHLGLELNFTHF